MTNKPRHQYSYTAICNGLAEPGTINREDMVADTEEARVEFENDIKTIVAPKFGFHVNKGEIIIRSVRYIGEVK